MQNPIVGSHYAGGSLVQRCVLPLDLQDAASQRFTSYANCGYDFAFPRHLRLGVLVPAGSLPKTQLLKLLAETTEDDYDANGVITPAALVRLKATVREELGEAAD